MEADDLSGRDIAALVDATALLGDEAARAIAEWAEAPPRVLLLREHRDGETAPAARLEENHKGALLEGKLGDTPVLAMEGRFHFYEGYTMKEVCYPFYVFKLLGIETVVLTNAAGGINRSFEPGTLMLITDTINMMGTNPLIGPNDERFGPRFPDMTEIFSHDLLDLARSVADRQGIAYREGVYMGFMGPCYETAAEIRAFAALGADAVGMSTVPEAMVCAYLGIKVLAVSCITNMATGIQTVRHSHARVLEIANQAGDRMCRWLGEVIQEMP